MTEPGLVSADAICPPAADGPIALGPSVGNMTVAEFTGLLTLTTSLLTVMEVRIIARIDMAAAELATRWGRHDEEFKRTLEAIDRRFEQVEGPLTAHLDRDRHGDMVLQARIKPIQTFAGFLGRNWRTVALLVVSILGIFGWAEVAASR